MVDKKKPPVGAEGQDSACETERVMRDAKHSATLPPKVKPDTAAAIDFLQRWNPSGPVVLTSIIPDGKTTTRTFDVADADGMRKWIDVRQGKQNLYFHVNPVRRPLTSKASKADIARLAWLHVDVDPRAGEPLDAERERILKALQAFEPRPTVIVASGSGLQGFWRLRPDSRLEVDGDVAKAEELEAYNVQLERVLGADHTHNIDRLMRLPGTVNVPNAKKRAKGRVPTLARLVSFDEAAVYPIDQFTAAERANVRTDTQRAAVRLGDGVARPCGTAELAAWAQEHGKTIRDVTLALIATGDTSEFDGDRSRMVLRVTGDLLRAEVPDEMILAVLTDRDNPVSAHVREQGDAVRYAQRQIDRARLTMSPPWDRTDKDGDPLPSYVNTRTALLLMGLECRYDKFRDLHLIRGHELQEYAGGFSDHAVRILTTAVLQRFGFDPAEANMTRAVLTLCTENRFDSLVDHLNALPPWDGTPRLDGWLVDHLHVEDNLYTREAGAAWLTAAVVRAFEPGAKFDQMLVLEGAQGLMKSTALRVLATGTTDRACSDRFSDTPFLRARDTREVLEATAGVWIMECAELDGITKRDVASLRAVITRQEDKGRLAYARTPVTVPRRFVLAGTTNESRYLQDTTGNRRFWPVAVRNVDIAGLHAARDQLLAEAIARYRSGRHRLLLTPEALSIATRAQDSRRAVDEGYMETLTDIGRRAVRRPLPDGRKAWTVTNHAVYTHLGIDTDHRTGKVPGLVREAMRALGWQKLGRVLKIDGEVHRVFVWEDVGDPPAVDAGGAGRGDPF